MSECVIKCIDSSGAVHRNNAGLLHNHLRHGHKGCIPEDLRMYFVVKNVHGGLANLLRSLAIQTPDQFKRNFVFHSSLLQRRLKFLDKL